MLPPPFFTVGMVLGWWWVVPGFLQTWRFELRPKSSILVSSNQRIFFSLSESLFDAFLLTPSELSCVFHWWEAFVWLLCHKALSVAVMVVLLEVSSISTQKLWSSTRVTTGFFITSLTKALLPWLLNLAGLPALGRVLDVPNFFHLRIMKAPGLLGTFNAAGYFVAFPQVDTILSLSLAGSSINLMAWFLHWYALSAVRP